MKRVRIDELLPGMILAKPATNASGLPVVTLGAELDHSVIDRLRQLGLTSIYVEGGAGDTTGKTLTELDAELEHRFRKVHQDPVQRMIQQQLHEHLRTTHGAHEQEESTNA